MKRSDLPHTPCFLHRERLSALLWEALSYQLVTVIAGSGYGKTSTVAHFLKDLDCKLIWLRLSGRHDEAISVWSEFTSALGRELPALSEKVKAGRFPDSPARFHVFHTLLSEAASHGSRLVVVVDDYESIQDESLIRFFNLLMNSDLDNFTLMVLCGTKMPFAGMKPAKGHFRISALDLAFTPEETCALFEQHGVGLLPAEAEDIIAETDGWPMALLLLAASRQKTAGGLAGKTYIHLTTELFEQNYYADYPRPIRHSLVGLSLLPDFPLDMLSKPGDAVGDDVYHVLSENPFVHYDYVTGLFIMQKMYRAFLARKQALLSREDRLEIYRRGGLWFLEHGRAYDAMDCYWEAGDYGAFLESVFAMPRIRERIGTTNSVLLRLEAIPRSFAETCPLVDFSRALMYMNISEMDKARDLLLQVADHLTASGSGEEDHLLLGDTYAALADISIYLNDDTGLDYIKKAADILPGRCRIHSTELMALGNNSAFYLPTSERGQLERMVDYYFEYARYADKVTGGSGYGFEYLFAGEAAFCREEMEKAAEMFHSSILKAQQSGQHDIICNAWWGLARIGFYYGRLKQASEAIKNLKAYVNDNQIEALFELRDSAMLWYHLKLDDGAKVSEQFSGRMPGPADRPVGMGRNLLIMTYCFFSMHEDEKAFAILTEMDFLTSRKGLWYERLCVHTLRARMLFARGELAEATRSFRRAYDMVYENDIKVVFAEFGREMLHIIDHVIKQEPHGFDLAWLDEVFQGAVSYAKRLQNMRRAHARESHLPLSAKPVLTKREDETLRYLAQGLTQQEIGRLMGISASAVKKHIKKIYDKLGAVNRADAIFIASINGLVELY